MILGSGRFPGGGHGNPLQYSCLENPWIEEPGRLQSMESLKSQQLIQAQMNELLKSVTHVYSARIQIVLLINKLDLIKIKSFHTAKENISKVKRQHSEWEKIVTNEATDKKN